MTDFLLDLSQKLRFVSVVVDQSLKAKSQLACFCSCCRKKEIMCLSASWFGLPQAE